MKAAQSKTGIGEFYDTSPVKRFRRSGDQLQTLLDAIRAVLEGEEGQITIRHLFYRLVGLNVIQKTEAAYKNLCQHLSKWRKERKISYEAFSDSTRWHIQNQTFDSMAEALENTVATYRRNLWATQAHYIEVWVEKDAIASIVSRVTDSFGVPLFVARGFASLSSLYSAAETFRKFSAAGKRCKIYHFGDYDPSGMAAGEAIQTAFVEQFNLWAVQFERAAITSDQIQHFSLPTRPVKMSDSRAAKWTGGECVELDSMLPSDLRSLVEGCITQHINQREWDFLKQTEAAERETLAQIRKGFAT